MPGFLLASDYDCTLRRWPDDITEEDKKAIRRFRELGNYFVIVSGRVFKTMDAELSGNGFRDVDMLLTMSGSLATDANGNIIYEHKGNGKIIGPLMETLVELNARLASVEVGKQSHSISQFPMQVFGNPITVEEASGFPYFTNFCSSFPTEEEAHRAAEVLKKRFGQWINPLLNGTSVDLPPAEVNKGLAVAKVAELLSVPHHKIYTAGDNYNDMDMLSSFHGRAMSGASDNVVKVAEKSVHSIAEIIEEILSL